RVLRGGAALAPSALTRGRGRPRDWVRGRLSILRGEHSARDARHQHADEAEERSLHGLPPGASIAFTSHGSKLAASNSQLQAAENGAPPTVVVSVRKQRHSVRHPTRNRGAMPPLDYSRSFNQRL